LLPNRPHDECRVCHASLRLVCPLVSIMPPCPGCRGGELDHLLVDAPHSFHLAPNRGRDLPIADSGGLPTPGAEFDLAESHGDDGCD
jgi:hypothetical protein